MVSVSALPPPVVLHLGVSNSSVALPRRGGWVGITSSWSCREELHQEMTSKAGGVLRITPEALQSPLQLSVYISSPLRCQPGEPEDPQDTDDLQNLDNRQDLDVLEDHQDRGDLQDLEDRADLQDLDDLQDLEDQDREDGQDIEDLDDIQDFNDLQDLEHL